MILANPTRLAAVVLTTFVAATLPASLLASGHGALGPQPPQTTPAKPSAAIMPPTSLPATPTTGSSNSAAKIEPPAEHFDVDVIAGKVTIDATNASLNKVMHEVAAQAGIKITGGVSDERVFGHYGPASPSVILATLLDGTGTNMLLVDDKNGASELILTQRVGGPTPPSPLATALEAAEDQDGRPTSRYVPPTRPFQPPGSFGPGRGQIAVPPNAGPSAGTNQSDPSQSSNEPRTPQQIYEQLQNANQQKQTTSSSPQK